MWLKILNSSTNSLSARGQREGEEAEKHGEKEWGGRCVNVWFKKGDLCYRANRFESLVGLVGSGRFRSLVIMTIIVVYWHDSRFLPDSNIGDGFAMQCKHCIYFFMNPVWLSTTVHKDIF